MILEAMFQRLFASLVHGPSMNARPHRSRQRCDWMELSLLNGVEPASALKTLLVKRQIELLVRVKAGQKGSIQTFMLMASHLIGALIIFLSLSAQAQTGASPGLAELELNGGAWPLGVNARWPAGISEEQMGALAAKGNANAQYLIAQPLMATRIEVIVPGSPIGVGVNASTLGRPAETRRVYNNVANAIEGTRLLIKAGQQGHILAQIDLGHLYERENNPQEAVKWYVKAAEQGSEDAMQALGTIYRDSYLLIDAYMWYALASAKCVQRNGNINFYIDQKNYLIRWLKPEEIEEAQKLIDDWNREHTK